MAVKSKSSAKKSTAKSTKASSGKSAVKVLTSAFAKLVKPAAKTGKKAAPAKAAAKPAAKKPAAKKPVAVAAAAKSAAKKAPAKKAAVKKAAAKKAAVVKQVPVKAAPARKPAVKASASKQPAAKQAVSKASAKSGAAGKQAKATKAPVKQAKPARTAAGKSAPKPSGAAGKTSKAVAKTAKPSNSNAGKQMGPANKGGATRRIEGGIKARAVMPSRPVGSDEVMPMIQQQRPTGPIDLPPGYKPSSGDGEYMSPEHLEYFRQKLLNWRAELVEESKQTIDNLREEVRDVGDDAERATRETENSLELRTRDRYRKLIGKIDKALKRVEDGAYGYCEETGEEIGLDRLEARPIATLSFDAQERWEHRQKLMGD